MKHPCTNDAVASSVVQTALYTRPMRRQLCGLGTVQNRRCWSGIRQDLSGRHRLWLFELLLDQRFPP